MLRPMTVAPTFSNQPSTIGVLARRLDRLGAYLAEGDA